MLTDMGVMQAIVADSEEGGQGLDVELSASGFGQHHQEVHTPHDPVVTNQQTM